jgi:two-component system, OmpR family, response regulator
VSAGRVLVIEDDVAVANLLRRVLEFKGIEVTITEDGAAGREAWESGDFDLILLDVMLPEVDGISLCAGMRAADDDTPVILVTARDEAEAEEWQMAAGATDYISKPFDFEELLSRVESHLQS